MNLDKIGEAVIIATVTGVGAWVFGLVRGLANKHLRVASDLDHAFKKIRALERIVYGRANATGKETMGVKDDLGLCDYCGAEFQSPSIRLD